MLHQSTKGILDGEAGGIEGIRIEPVDHFATYHPIIGIGFFYLADGHGIGQFAGLCGDGMLTGQGDLEGVDFSAHLGGNLRTIHQQGHFAPVGVDLDLGFVLSTVYIPAATEVNKGFLAPVGLVQIECILSELPVEGYQTLLVFAVLAAFVTSIGSEIKEVPCMGCPQIGPFLDAFQQMLMVNALIGFGIVALFRILTLILRVGIGAILGESDHPIGELLVVIIKELVVLLQLTQIPAEIQVVAADIRDIDEGRIGFQHKHMGHGGGAGFVHSVAQIIQYPVVIQQVLGNSSAGGDFVRKSPADDGRMVIALGDEFPHLGDGILPAVGHMGSDVGNLCPGDNAILVAEVIEFLRVLVVGEADGVGTDFTDEFHVLFMFFDGQCVAKTLPVLMAADTTQRVNSAIQQKAVLCTKSDFPTTESDRNLITAVQPCFGAVQIGIFHTVPQVDIVDYKGFHGMPIFRGDDLCMPCNVHMNAVCILPCLYRYHSQLLFQIHNRSHLDAGSAVLAQFKMVFGYQNQIHAAIQTAVKSEVRLLGINPIVIGIVHRYAQKVFFLQMVCDVYPEGGIATLVVGKVGTIQVHIRGHSCTKEFQYHNTFVGRLGECLGIHGSTPPVVVSSVLAILGIPGMGQGHLFPCRQGCRHFCSLGKAPVIVKVQNISHSIPLTCFPPRYCCGSFSAYALRCASNLPDEHHRFPDPSSELPAGRDDRGLPDRTGPYEPSAHHRCGE